MFGTFYIALGSSNTVNAEGAIIVNREGLLSRVKVLVLESSLHSPVFPTGYFQKRIHVL